jgi:hypothetical protein
MLANGRWGLTERLKGLSDIGGFFLLKATYQDILMPII